MRGTVYEALPTEWAFGGTSARLRPSIVPGREAGDLVRTTLITSVVNRARIAVVVATAQTGRSVESA